MTLKAKLAIISREILIFISLFQDFKLSSQESSRSQVPETFMFQAI
jgi:hypothetical protein